MKEKQKETEGSMFFMSEPAGLPAGAKRKQKTAIFDPSQVDKWPGLSNSPSLCSLHS